MKKFFKCSYIIGGIILVVMVVFIILASCYSSSESPKQTTVTQTDVWDRLAQLNWEKESHQELLTGSAETHVREFLAQKEIKEGYDPEKKLFCAVTSAPFRAKNYAIVKMFRKTAELKAFLFFLSEFASYLKTDIKINDKKEVITTSLLKWGDYLSKQRLNPPLFFLLIFHL